MSKNEMVIKAKLALNSLETKTHEDGTRFVSVKDDAPDWLEDLCRDAHDDMLPDDFVFETIQEALSAIVDNDGDTDAVELEADCYNSDLIAWLGSHSRRPGYCDDAAEEYGTDGGIMGMIRMGQYAEKREILYSVISSLENVDLEEAGHE